MSVQDRIDLVDGAFWGRNPHDDLRWLRDHAPVWRDPRHGVWGVATHALVKHVSTHPELFSSAGGIRPEHPPAPNMIDMDDPLHKKHRKLVSSGFTPRRVRDQEAAIRSTVRLLIDEVRDRGRCDLVTDIAAWLPLIVIGDALGVHPPDRGQLLQWSDDLMRSLGSSDHETIGASKQAWAEFQMYAAKIIATRRKHPTDDLVSVLVQAEVDGDRFDDNEITSELLLILIGGDETTRHVISGGAHQLLAKRERWLALREDRQMMPTAVEEMLRWVSPVKNMARTATADVELGGQAIPAGDKLLLLYPSANRDDAVFADPDDFDICRTPNDHMAFGFGPHFCLGASLARLELRVLFEELLDGLPHLELVDPAEPHLRPANFVTGFESLPVRWSIA